MPKIFGGVRIFNVEEIARKFNSDNVTVRRYFRTGRLPGRKFGKRWYMTESQVEEYFRKGQQSGEGEGENE